MQLAQWLKDKDFSRQRLKKPALLAALLVVLVLAAAFWLFSGTKSSSNAFRTIAVQRGDLDAVISATGTVEPEEVVDIGAQVAGKILSFGKDKNGKPVDYGSVVEPNMVLAQIDDSLYAADVASSKAQLEQAKAAMVRAQADLEQMKAKLFQAERDWHRAQTLGPSDALSQADYDAARSAYDVAKANVEVDKAAIEQAKATVSQTQAALRRAQQNLDYCTIRSPVKGVIVDRRVNIGQTVVSSLNAPSLFLIAKDLTRIQVWISVNEADIGNIKPGQQVNFTVDAYPNQVFKGEVGKVRLNATMTQNVVTYTVEVNTDNQDGKLLPYLTANAQFMVSHRENVLVVPNAALRWTPKPDQIAKGGAAKTRKGGGKPQQAGAPPQAGAPAKPAREEFTRGVLWLPQGNQVKALSVRLGPTDGSLTEVAGADLKEGTKVVVGEQIKEAEAPAATESPFTPKLFGGGSGSSRR